MSLLNRFYDRFRYSFLYETVSRLRGTPYARTMESDREFFRQFFKEQSVLTVFDVGANIGDKAAIFQEMSDHVLCIEADPNTADKLSTRFASSKKVVIRNVAVGEQTGTARMVRKNHSGFNTLSKKWSEASSTQGVSEIGSIDVPVTTLDLLIAEHGCPDYIKIDVEGYELPAIRGLTSKVKAISFEANIPTFLDETKVIIDTLFKLQPTSRFNLRIMESRDFHLAQFVKAEELLSVLEENSPFTCDVFAVKDASN